MLKKKIQLNKNLFDFNYKVKYITPILHQIFNQIIKNLLW